MAEQRQRPAARDGGGGGGGGGGKRAAAPLREHVWSPIACASLATGLCCLLNVVALYHFYARKDPRFLLACVPAEVEASRRGSAEAVVADGEERDTCATPAAAEALRRIFETAPRTYALVFSTGRAGTQHLSRTLVSGHDAVPSLPRAYITHQEESAEIATRDYVDARYRPLAALAGGEGAFNASARAFVEAEKLPFWEALLQQHGAQRMVYTGHLPAAFGLVPALLDAVPRGSLRVLRLRRDRVSAAASLMALGPPEGDPWADGGSGTRRRWFPHGPGAAMTRLRVREGVWATFNRFQRWLWYVDDVECRWQALVAGRGEEFEWAEESLEGLAALDGGRGWRRVAAFLGVALDRQLAFVRDNSIQDKGREKVGGEDEAILRRWDVEYRQAVGLCDLSGDGSRWVSWGPDDGQDGVE
jgi:hypothetical protein